MKLVHKRIMIFFSVALNIGFLAMSIFHAYDQAVPRKDRRWKELVAMVNELDLPDARSKQVVDLMAGFRETLDRIEKEDKRSRMETLTYLATPGPVDKERLHELLMTSALYSRKKRALFETHVMEMRRLLGDDAGPRFFSRLKTHVASSHRSGHP